MLIVLGKLFPLALFIQRRKLFAQLRHFGHVVKNYIGLIRMQCQIVLVILLGWKELLQRHDLRDDRHRKSAYISELLDIILCSLLLFRAGVKNRRSILSAAIRALAIWLRGIVRYAEKTCSNR